MKILILEDDARRRDAMRDCLGDRFFQYETLFFDNAAEMCAYLQTHLPSALVISLDHDLELKPQANGKPIDMGTGREVADFLAARTPACPVVIATTNSASGDGMEFLLREANWETHRVQPWGDLDWIPTQWFRAVRNAIVGAARSRTTTA